MEAVLRAMQSRQSCSALRTQSAIASPADPYQRCITAKVRSTLSLARYAAATTFELSEAF
jgi:hypothetical protein